MTFDLAADHWSASNAAACLHGQLALLANRKSATFPLAAPPEWLARATRMILSWPHFVGGVPEFIRLYDRSHEHASRDCRPLNIAPRRYQLKFHIALVLQGIGHSKKSATA